MNLALELQHMDEERMSFFIDTLLHLQREQLCNPRPNLHNEPVDDSFIVWGKVTINTSSLEGYDDPSCGICNNCKDNKECIYLDSNKEWPK